MNKLDLDYQALLKDILDNGYKKGDRTGTGTISKFGMEIRHKMSDGFPLLTSKKMSFKNIATELLWFLQGRTDLRYLIENGCHIWDGDAYKAFEKLVVDTDQEIRRQNPTIVFNPLVYESKEEFIEKIKTSDEFSKNWGDLGSIYGKQWRRWSQLDGVEIDQIQTLINTLKTNPDDRRMLVTAWNPAEIYKCVLPPCHYGFQCYTRELTLDERNEWYFNTSYQNPTSRVEWKDYELDQQNVPKRALSLKWNQRSCDSPLGIPYNIASYGLLLEILAKIVNMVPDELIGSFGDTHIYLNQIEGVKEQLNRESYDLPKLNIKIDLNNFVPENWSTSDFELLGYKSQEKIYFPLSN